MQRDDKSWSSDRTMIPLPQGNNLNVFARNTNQAANRFPLTPFTGRRTLPSKWDDAERWIRSPVDCRHANPANTSNSIRRPKSKSGPLCRPNFPNLSSSSTSATHCFSPFDTSVMTADEVLLRLRNGTLGDIFDGIELRDDETNDVRAVSRRDMATQMSPRSSICSSPKDVVSFPCCPSPSLRGEFPARPDIRDVDIDKRASIISWSKRPGRKPWWMDSREPLDGFTGTVIEASPWQFGDAAKDESWVQKEEARIAAWENLQKARAEAAIRKLEMKLEKKRSSSMEKILSKLRAAERKSEEMRGSLSEDGDASRRTKPLLSWFRCDAF